MFRFTRPINASALALRPMGPVQPTGAPNSLLFKRLYSDVKLSDYEQLIYNKLQNELSPQQLEVMDISGGCGSMFAISVVSESFKGLTMIKQHKLVNSILADEIAKWHGLQLKTKAPL